MAKYLNKTKKKSGSKALGLVIGCLVLLAVFLIVRGMLPGDHQLENGGADSGKQEQVQSADHETETTVETDTSGETGDEQAALTVDTVEQDGDMMVVTTSYCTVKYPFAFSDIIQVEAVQHNGKDALMFQALLGDGVYSLFCFVFDGTEGVPVGTLTLEDGTEVMLMLEIFEASTAMEGSFLNTFYAAQETLNDVIGSLMEIEEFVPAA